MELAKGLYGLAQEVEFGGTPMTLHSAAVETPQGLLLLDAGLPGGTPDLVEALEDENLSLDDVWAITITHQDIDHAGCLSDVVGRTDATVFAHEEETPYLEGTKELVKTTDEGPIPLEPTTVDIQITGGETFTTDAGPMRAISTPGHSPGHTSFYFPDAKLLVSGDVLNVVDGELVGPREDVTPDLETAWESVATLADLDTERTLCYHGGHAEAGSDRLEALLAERRG